jgi:hypothetical protein
MQGTPDEHTMADEGRGSGGQAPNITNEMVAQFMLNQQAMNERLQDSTDQMNARIQALLAVMNDTTTGAAGTTLPTSIYVPSTSGAFTPRPPSVRGQETPATHVPRKPKHTAPHPEKFTGEDETVYPIFRGLLEAKLRTDAQAIGGEYEQVWYAFGRLTETASKRIFPWIQYMQNTPDFTVHRLLEQMDLAFLDLQKQAKAIGRINVIKQRNRPFREFLQEFDQTLMEANGWGWQDEVKKGLLKAAVTSEVKRELVGRDEAVTYAAYVAQIRKITDDLDEWKEGQRVRSRPRQPLTTHQDQPANEQMDWEPTRTAPVASTRTSQQSRSKPRAKWVSQQEIDRRKEASECLRCGSKDHFIRQCSLASAKKPETTPVPAKRPKVRAAVAKTKKKRPPPLADQDTSSEEKSGSEYGSGNE